MKSLIDIPKKMQALVLHSVGELTLDQVDVPELTEGTVLVKIMASGICSSDTERVFINGTYHFPTIPGHEFSGKIVAIGDNVDEKLLGRRTCVFPLLPCGKCKACSLEEYAQCSNYNYFGSRCDGGFAEYIVVPVWNLIPFDDSVSYKTASLCEPSSVSIHAINVAQIKEGQTVAVIGTGTIGFLIALFAKKVAKKVIICGYNKSKLEFAKKLGLEIVNTDKGDVVKGIKAICGSDGADITFEAVGSNGAIQTAITATGALGKIVLVGNPKEDLYLPKNIYWSILRKQLAVVGSWNSSFNSKINDWKMALEVFEDKDLNLADMITHTFDMKDADEAFAVLKNSREFSLKATFIIAEE